MACPQSCCSCLYWGHIGVVVDTGKEALPHAGDAYMFDGQVAAPPRSTPGLNAIQKKVETIPERLRKVAPLRELRTTTEVTALSAHDLIEFEGWQKRNV